MVTLCWKEQGVMETNLFSQKRGFVQRLPLREALWEVVGRILSLALLTSISFTSFAQNAPYLERVVTITFHEERLDAALNKLSRQGGFTFSYSPSVVETGRLVNQSFTNKTVREILDVLFNGTIQYKAKGRYIILTKAQISSTKEKQLYSGYIVDESTGERLEDVTVYDPVTLASATTDAFGYFEIKIDKPPTDLKLAVNKKNYADTIIAVPSRNGRLLNIPIKVNKERFRTFADSVGNKMSRLWQKTKLLTRQRLTLENVNDTLFRKFQVSFIPFIGTNHALSGNVVNDYSYNIIGGLSRGVRKVELGGVFNMVLGDVRGFQFAGTFNAVGGTVTGVQLAGVFNANRKLVDGFQLAGVMNFNYGGARKFSAAGVMNFSIQDSRAWQLAGVGNISGQNQTQPHFAGVFNMTARDAKSQFAGTFNVSGKNMHGWQAAGVFNFAAKTVRGVQTAGVLNFAGKEVHGAQVGGVLNFAKTVRGIQIGLVNVSDTIKGVPIGLLSIVMKGYHKIEASTDELLFANVAFRTGVRQFYNILTVGTRPATLKGDSTFWTFGYGIGTAPRVSKKWFLNFDITSNQIMKGNSADELNMVNKLYVGLDYQFARKMSLTFGATLNAFTTENLEITNDVFKNYKPSIISEKTSGRYNTQMWFGGKVGLRFL
jgi:hypothetical protein